MTIRNEELINPIRNESGYRYTYSDLSVLTGARRFQNMSLGDDISANRLKLYTAYKKLRNVVCIEVRVKSIMVYLRLTPSEADVKEGFYRSVSKIGHWGTGDVEITIKNEEDFNKAKDYILKAYQVN